MACSYHVESCVMQTMEVTSVLFLVCRGMRSGTIPHPLVVGMGAACEIAAQEMEVGVVIDKWVWSLMRLVC